MAAAIEARSLGLLTTIASDPPLYPRNPTQLPHAPLTLYIVRVPGSKDVFLTPLKPREKVVSAEDVQSSLYFLHIDIPEDDLLELPEEIPVQDAPGSSTISRKPLPTPPTSPGSESPRQRSRPSLDTRASYATGGASRSSYQGHFTPEEDERCVSLTLIRRDPSSGSQWNVAKIRDPPVHEVSSVLGGDGSVKTKKEGAPLFLEIFNPGYSKFLQFDHARPVSRGSTDMSTFPSHSASTSDHDSTFRRRLYMDGSRFGDHSYGHRKTPSWTGEQQSQRPSVQLKRQSLQAAPKALIDRRTKGYTFRSPWGGKCEFATGAAGRSLKCKHVLENPSSAVTEVSELRFNLPTGTSKSGVSADSGLKRSSVTSRPGIHRHTTSDELTDGPFIPGMARFLDEHGNIDLSLGQERAGGGFGGKQAKLGKLIIEDEGVKMLDLIVAANMALWWRAMARYKTCHNARKEKRCSSSTFSDRSGSTIPPSHSPPPPQPPPLLTPFFKRVNNMGPNAQSDSDDEEKQLELSMEDLWYFMTMIDTGAAEDFSKTTHLKINIDSSDFGDWEDDSWCLFLATFAPLSQKVTHLVIHIKGNTIFTRNNYIKPQLHTYEEIIPHKGKGKGVERELGLDFSDPPPDIYEPDPSILPKFTRSSMNSRANADYIAPRSLDTPIQPNKHHFITKKVPAYKTSVHVYEKAIIPALINMFANRSPPLLFITIQGPIHLSLRRHIISSLNPSYLSNPILFTEAGYATADAARIAEVEAWEASFPEVKSLKEGVQDLEDFSQWDKTSMDEVNFHGLGEWVVPSGKGGMGTWAWKVAGSKVFRGPSLGWLGRDGV
ncbi:hypothetical protein E4T43_03557 [Aureobasidium subglaciale]|nr:hypothetical protein E4T43_03557 [Aureobasidium subglaciale]